MKKKLVLALILSLTLLTACTNDFEGYQDLPVGYRFVDYSVNENAGYAIATVQHIETGCYFVVSDWTGTGLTQFMIEKDGVSVPYCPEGENQ